MYLPAKTSNINDLALKEQTLGETWIQGTTQNVTEALELKDVDYVH